MIRRIFARNFRCLRRVDVRLDGSFHVLVGPNGSGKSSLIDVIGLLSDLTSLTLRETINRRTRQFRDLVWAPAQESDPALSLGVEFDVEALLANEEEPPEAGSLEYSVQLEDGEDGVEIRRESVRMTRAGAPPVKFERTESSTEYWIGPRRIELVHHGSDSMFHFIAGMLQHGPVRDRPITRAFDRLRGLLSQRVTHLFLDSRRLRQPSPSTARGTRQLAEDGSNLPWVVRELRNAHRDRFEAWLSHIRSTFRDIRDVRVTETDDNREGYLKVRYGGGTEVPSWGVSDGTLRVMALTVLAYLPSEESYVLMIEEPENGLHPLAIETGYQSLSSIYDSHVLLASHSPLLLRCAEPREVLSFGQRRDGSTTIVRGDQHPRLADWGSVLDNDLLFTHGAKG